MAGAQTSVMRGSSSVLGRWGAAAAILAGMNGRKRFFAAIFFGMLAAPALPPLGYLAFLPPSICGLIWLLDGAKSRRAAFWTGWAWGWGWYSVGFYWIGNAMLVDPERFAWMIPFATLGLGAVQAVFLGLAAAAAWSLRLSGAARVVALAGCWMIAEWVRAWFLTGFPWNPLGSVWDAVPSVLQTASVFGVYGLCGLTILSCGLFAVLGDFAPRRTHVAAVLGAVLPVLTAAGFGAWRLAEHPTETVPGIQLRIVQAAIAQRHMWRDDLRAAQLQEHVDLSRGPGFEKTTHVIWPETAAPFFLDQDAAHRAPAVRAAPPGGLLLTGAPRIQQTADQPLQIWNSLMAFDGAGNLHGVYDKVHLVPFGEYVPGRGLLPIAKLTAGGTDFSAGPGLRTLDLPGLPPVGPFICYEAVFPGEVVGRDQPRPEWMLTVTNDGWFGVSAGPHQHLAAGRMRAVEEGLPLVRAANTGISAVIDPLGRETARLDLGVKGVLDAQLPRPVEPGFYSEWGNKIPLTLAVVMIISATIAGRWRETVKPDIR